VTKNNDFIKDAIKALPMRQITYMSAICATFIMCVKYLIIPHFITLAECMPPGEFQVQGTLTQADQTYHIKDRCQFNQDCDFKIPWALNAMHPDFTLAIRIKHLPETGENLAVAICLKDRRDLSDHVLDGVGIIHWQEDQDNHFHFQVANGEHKNWAEAKLTLKRLTNTATSPK